MAEISDLIKDLEQLQKQHKEASGEFIQAFTTAVNGYLDQFKPEERTKMYAGVVVELKEHPSEMIQEAITYVD
jgi:hypothetical protein